MISFPVVLLIFISSNNRDGDLPSVTSAGKNVKESPSTERIQLEKLASRVNDLSLPNLKDFNNDRIEEKSEAQKDIVDPLLNKEKSTKRQEPMPMYSLIKNGCEEGYVIDENGVCQKAVTIRNDQKKFDSESKRRKRYIQDLEITGQRNLKPFFEHFDKTFQDRILAEALKGKRRINCGEVYPGLVSDGTGGCRKADFSQNELTQFGLPPLRYPDEGSHY